jgi:hypothetical protein
MAGKHGLDLETFRALFRDSRVWITVAQVEKLGLADDKSVLRLQVRPLPEGNSIIASMTWEAVGDGGGWYSFPTIGDLVLIAYSEGNLQAAYVIRRLTNTTDKIPDRAETMDVLRAVPGRKLSVSSDTMVLIGSGGTTEENEPIVLGLVLKEALGKIYDKISDILDKIINGPLGVDSIGGTVVTNPALATNLTTIKTQWEADKTQYVDTATTDILSQIAFTERGD